MLTDNRVFNVVVPDCPLCHSQWIYYDGALGYESLVCNKCRFDINEIKITTDQKGDNMNDIADKQEECDHQLPDYKGASFKDGKCTQCGYLCQHDELEDWHCLDCGELVEGFDIEPPDDYEPEGA